MNGILKVLDVSLLRGEWEKLKFEIRLCIYGLLIMLETGIG